MAGDHESTPDGGTGTETQPSMSQPESHTYTKATSIPLTSLLDPSEAAAANGVAGKTASDLPLHMDFSSSKLGMAFWTEREHLVVKARQGSVLTRGLVVKTDHFAGGEWAGHGSGISKSC